MKPSTVLYCAASVALTVAVSPHYADETSDFCMFVGLFAILVATVIYNATSGEF